MSLSVPDLASPDSPFIPGTSVQYAWDSVSLTSAMSCWRQYYYTIVRGLVSKNPNTAIALDFGIAFHKGQEHYHDAIAEGQSNDEAIATTIQLLTANPHYSRLPTHDEVMEKAESTPDDDDGIDLRNSRIRTRYHLLRSLVWYFEHYANDPAKTLIGASSGAAVEVSFRLELPLEIAGHPVLLCGHIDRAVEFNGAYYCVDYKTTKSLSRQFFAMFDLSHQMTGYTIAGNIIFDRPISGVIVDGVALQVGGCQYQRSITRRTDGQITEYLATVQNTLREAEEHADTDSWPMNTSACYFCNFKEICAKPPEFREGYIKQLFHENRGWNPLENR